MEFEQFFEIDDAAVWPTDRHFTKEHLIQNVKRGGAEIKEAAQTIVKDIDISEEDVKRTLAKGYDMAEEEIRYLAPEVSNTIEKSTDRLDAKPQLISGVSNAVLFYSLGGLVLYALIKNL
jgi:hypothetical protein